jgi:hypothetical protein
MPSINRFFIHYLIINEVEHWHEIVNITLDLMAVVWFFFANANLYNHIRATIPWDHIIQKLWNLKLHWWSAYCQLIYVDPVGPFLRVRSNLIILE